MNRLNKDIERERAVLVAITFALGLIAVLVAMMFVGEQDYQEEARQQSVYCQMVEKHLADAKAGIEPALRAGWPDYKGNFEEVCK